MSVVALGVSNFQSQSLIVFSESIQSSLPRLSVNKMRMSMDPFGGPVVVQVDKILRLELNIYCRKCVIPIPTEEEQTHITD